MNAHQDPVDAETVLSAVETTAGPDARETAAGLTTTETAPDVWSRSAHVEAFGEAPARIAVGFAEAPFAASGPYRNATVAATDSARREPTVALYAGETLTVTGRAENGGEAAGEYQVRFGVDGRVVDSASGSLQPGDAATHTFARTFATAGQRVVSVGAEEVTVSVREPAQATVTGLAANRTTISGGGAVELTATVENSYDVPAVANLSLSGEMGTVFDRRVSLGPGETRTVSSSVTLSEPGEYSFAFGEQRVVVTVERAASGDVDGSSGVGPGFGPLAAVVGLLVAAARLARRRR
jgi:PGF-CTERM protein